MGRNHWQYDTVAQLADIEDEIGDILTFPSVGYSLSEKTKNEFNAREVNAKWFGAIGDGIHDDTISIQSAIDSLPTGTFGGGSVLLPSGNYKISASINLKSGVILKGVSPQATRVFATDADFAMFKWQSCRHSGVENIMVDGVGLSGVYGLSLYDSIQIWAKNIWMDSFNTALYTVNTYYVDFSDIRIMGTENGYRGDAGSNVINLCNVNMLTTVSAILWHNSSSLSVDGCSFEGVARITIYIAQGYSFKGCYFEGMHPPVATQDTYFALGNASGGYAAGGEISGCFFLGYTNYAITFYAVDGVSIKGCYFGTVSSAFNVSQYDNAPKRNINVGGNSYDIGQQGHDPTKIYHYDGSLFDGLNCNLNDYHTQPMQLAKVGHIPQNSSLGLEEAVLYWDGTALKCKVKDASGVVTIKTVTLT